jgi:predicted RNA binding protein with dsRBD fold (UPF0201 family)
MEKIIVSIKVSVNPTEDIDKIKVAIQKVFGVSKLEIVNDKKVSYLIGKFEGLEAIKKFYYLLRKELILDASRRVLIKGIKGKKINFNLNKQVAYSGHISFSQPEGESPLGTIDVEIECDNPRLLIDWLTPPTIKKKKTINK